MNSHQNKFFRHFWWLLGSAFLVSAFASFTFTQETRQLTAEKPPVSNKRTALVIGNANYQTARTLANPVNDATDMAAALKELGFDVISGTDLTLRQMREKVREFGDKLKANGGVGLFYYAGHGVQVKGTNYLIPVDADIAREDEIEDSAYSLDSLFGKVATANNGLNIVILDACRNNPFARSWSRSLDAGGLAQVNAPTGTIIAYATEVNKTASDGPGRNGVYTGEFLKAMKRPYVKIEETFKDVLRAVRESSKGNQTPWLSTSISGDFFFVPPMGNTALYSRWEAMLKRKDYSSLIEETTSELKGNPRNIVALRMRAEAYSDTNMRNATSDQIAIGKLKVNPSDEYEYEAICYANGYIAYPDAGDDDRAVAECNEAIKINPSLGVAYVDRGIIFRNRKKEERAIADFTRAIEIDSKYTRPYAWRGGAYFETGEYDLAIADFTTALALKPRSYVLLDRAWAYYKQKKYDQALADLSNPSDFTNSVLAYLRRGRIYYETKKYDLAIAEFSKAIIQSRDYHIAEPFYGRALCYFEMQKRDLALLDYAEAIKVDPQYIPAYRARAKIYRLIGKEALASEDERVGDVLEKTKGWLNLEYDW